MTKENNLEMLDMIGRDTPEDEIESLRAQLGAANAEVQEQARLNGMGAEREAKLRAQLEEVRREVDFQVQDNCQLQDQLLATQAHAARLVEAISEIERESNGEDGRVFELVHAIAADALSTPINLDALHEDRALTLEEAKRRIYSGEFDTLCAEDAIQCIAYELRAKKEGK